MTWDEEIELFQLYLAIQRWRERKTFFILLHKRAVKENDRRWIRTVRALLF